MTFAETMVSMFKPNVAPVATNGFVMIVVIGATIRTMNPMVTTFARNAKND